MDIVTKRSENQFAELLSFITEEPALWMCIHLNMAAINEETLNSEGLSRQYLEKIQHISDEIAKKMRDMGLNKLEGRIFVFDDGDVAAVFLCAEPSDNEIIEKLRNIFILQGLGQFFHSYYMKDKMASLITLANEKISSAADYKLKLSAVEWVEKIFTLEEPDISLRKAIQKKRNSRTTGAILIIEDDLISRGMIASALKKEYKVFQAKDAKSGIAAYIHNAPNIVLLDIHLPDHTGHEVLNRLKFLDPEAYVIMVSADSVSDNVLLTNICGSAGFIKKPFLKEKLLEYIKKCPTMGVDATAKTLGWGRVSEPFKVH